MAIIDCAECKQHVSEFAQSCPHCGFPPQTRGRPPIDVNVKNVDMHFATMVGFLVKLAIAAIPAVIILVIIGAAAVAVIQGVHHR